MDSVNLIVSAAATVIALAALGLSVYEAMLSRRHARLSVRPLLDSELHVSSARDRFCLVVTNNGLGPAIIKKWQLLVDGKPYRDLGITRWEQLTAHLKLSQSVSYSYFEPNSILAPEESEELIGYAVAVYSQEEADRFREAIRHLAIIIDYESMYREPFSFEFRGSEYFKS
jgi:hypothetical protein